MIRRSVLLSILSVGLAVGTGCNAARYVTLEQNGGIVAIPSNSNTWPYYHRSKAEELMAKRCPQGYVVEGEEEVVVGQTQYVDTNTEKSGDPVLAALHVALVNEHTKQTTTYQNQTEWRIRFRGK
jgi:hypothetical protein